MSDPSAKRRPAAQYDPAVLKPFQAAIESGLDERARTDNEHRERQLLLRKIDYIYELLGLISNGLPHRPVHERGEIVVSPRIWAQDILHLAVAWTSCHWLFDHNEPFVPCIVTPEGNRALGFDAANNVFDLACRGGSLDDVERSITEHLEQLRILRDRSTIREVEDAPWGMHVYFSKLHSWFFITGGDIWKHGIKELRISLRVPSPGQVVTHVPRMLAQAAPDATLVAPKVVESKGTMAPDHVRRRRGAPKKYVPEDDKRIWDAWTIGEFSRYDDLARELGGITEEEVAGAVDRHRKRLEDQQRARRQGSD